MASLTHAGAIIISRHTEMTHRAEAARSLRAADRRKDEFLAVLSHELRNPLASMRNAIELLLRTEGTSAAAARPLATLDRQMVHLVSLLDDLLDLSRISQGRFDLKRQRVELGSLLQHALEPARVLAEGTEQEIRVGLPAEPIHVDADPVRVAQVFGNLMSNACRYTDRGGRILCSVRREGEEAVVAIEDNGIGIPRDKLEAIFEIFAQVDRSLGRSRGGLGIGLHLARQLVEMHAARSARTAKVRARGVDSSSACPSLRERAGNTRRGR